MHARRRAPESTPTQRLSIGIGDVSSPTSCGDVGANSIEGRTRPSSRPARGIECVDRASDEEGDSIDFDTGAGLGVPALTAHRCLFADGGIQGKTILVHGGGGGVGQPAIQLAAWAGARVLTTVSRAEQEASARRAGAHSIINRRTQDVVAAVQEATNGKGIDRVVDVDFAQNLHVNLGVLKVGGVIATYFSTPVEGSQFPFFLLMVNCIRVDFVLVYTMSAQAHQDAIRDTTACLEAGGYKTDVGARFTLDQLVDAHEAQDSGTIVGKILVDVA